MQFLLSTVVGIVLSLAPVFFPVRPALPVINQAPQNLITDTSIQYIENAYIQNSIFAEQAGPGLPVRLVIPTIAIDTAIEYVGLTPEGVMDMPKSVDGVAWLELGQRPGENGSAVIAGHYGWRNGKGSAFDDLYKLRHGDKVYVEDNMGSTLSFVVRGSRRYDPNEDAAEVFGSSDGKAHLNLITCEGVWDPVTKGYPKRLVVFADREE